MALRPSKALRNYMLDAAPFQRAMAHCVLKAYSGSQPANAEAAPTGTLLVTYSDAGGSLTREVRPVGSVALTAGASGSVDTLTVAGLEVMGSSTAFDTDLATTAQAVIDKINSNPHNCLVDASLTSTSTITLTSRYGLGTLLGSATVASTATTITKTDTNMTAGTAPANGLLWDDAAAGVVAKKTGQTWQGTAVADGTAGWFRFEASVTDAGGLDSSEAVLRLDGSISTSGAELNMGSTSIVTSSVQTVSSFAITFPIA